MQNSDIIKKYLNDMKTLSDLKYGNEAIILWGLLKDLVLRNFKMRGLRSGLYCFICISSLINYYPFPQELVHKKKEKWEKRNAKIKK